MDPKRLLTAQSPKVWLCYKYWLSLYMAAAVDDAADTDDDVITLCCAWQVRIVVLQCSITHTNFRVKIKLAIFGMWLSLLHLVLS